MLEQTPISFGNTTPIVPIYEHIIRETMKKYKIDYETARDFVNEKD